MSFNAKYKMSVTLGQRLDVLKNKKRELVKQHANAEFDLLVVEAQTRRLDLAVHRDTKIGVHDPVAEDMLKTWMGKERAKTVELKRVEQRIESIDAESADLMRKDALARSQMNRLEKLIRAQSHN